MEQATLGSGCFWCSEAMFKQLKGVNAVKSGYSGGLVENPTYEQVCSGVTKHAEVVQITYDPVVISYSELLKVFWKIHDPTTLNRQGNDVGTQYRSSIFYHNDEQKKLAELFKQKLIESEVWSKPIVTEIIPLTNFYPAGNYHDDYFNQHRNQPYCAFVVAPKVEEFQKIFKGRLS